MSEKERMKQFRESLVSDSPWEKWGPYVSERAWGTVREDYSADGNAWTYFTHDMARSKACRWGEDGIAGICDRYQVAVFSWAFWNEKDPILKERLFGLAMGEGNHGEDVKECYYYLDNVPTHSYMKYLYKYPQNEFPYQRIVEENKKRQLQDREFELVDTGIFNENRYFDIFIEYAKADLEDLCIKVEIINRGPEEAPIHVIPQVLFRNTWDWGEEHLPEPLISRGESKKGARCLLLDDSGLDPVARINVFYKLGKRYLYGDERAKLLFTNNETNCEKLFNMPSQRPHVKDAFHRFIVNKENCINPSEVGTKACFHYSSLRIPAGKSEVIYLRLTDKVLENPLDDVQAVIDRRKAEADEFYAEIHPKNATDEEKKIQRQAFAGMLWNKQIYLYDVNVWLKGDNTKFPPPESRHKIRNVHWRHLNSKRILSMPDKWEYPWFAAWDLAFHTITLALVDMEFAKSQLWFLLFDQFQHPNGQIPAYEWEFSDMNPPVQAWAAYRLFTMEYEKTGRKDYSFLKKCFHKLILNFVWWVNKVDSKGNNVFEGGFLGLDNITVFDRSAKIPGGGRLEQSDGTGWVGLFCLMLMRMSIELAGQDRDYEGMATKFFEHFIYIANALDNAENRETQLWDEEDGFLYDVLCYPDQTNHRIKVRSLVGIIPLYAIDSVSEEEIMKLKGFYNDFTWFCNNRQQFVDRCVTKIEKEGKKSYLFSLLSPKRIERVLQRVWDPNEFRSPYGLRSLSKVYQKGGYELLGNRIAYEPGEAEMRLKGGNSNWRGPLWFPTTFLFVDAMKKLHAVMGESIQVRAGDEKPVHLDEVGRYFARAMISLFQRDQEGRKPIFGDYELFQKDPHFKEYFFFYEHYHADTGRGLGASHQTGWSGLIANFIDEWRL